MTKTIATFRTKAETLELLANECTNITVLPLFYFTAQEWQCNPEQVLFSFYALPWSKDPLIVRSSSLAEDGYESSQAGAFSSFLNVQSKEALIQSIEKTLSSYEKYEHPHNQILIQPFLQQVSLSGVAFTQDPQTNEDYYVINYDAFSQSTDTVTSGSTNSLKTYIHYHKATKNPPQEIQQVIQACKHLQLFFNTPSLDIEFAIDQQKNLIILQVRPLILREKDTQRNQSSLKEALERIAHQIENLSKPHPYLFGKKTLFGNMTDWNPAEIIGAKPRSLALSLYRNLVTDQTWAYQRNNYGYLNLRSFPLLIDFEGIPYIDIRVSFNSFIPKTLPAPLAEKLVQYYLQQLEAHPHLHDKVEFEIVFASYHFSLKNKLSHLLKKGFSNEEIETLFESLNHLTQTIATSEDALWKKDLDKIEILKKRQEDIYHHSQMSPLSKMYWLIEDCKRYGVLPFAGLARAGFIGVEILKSLHHEQLLTDEQYDQFFKSLKTVSSQIQEDFSRLKKEEFLKLYGHLRPGTYDLLLPSYNQAPDTYFDWDSKRFDTQTEKHTFDINLDQLRAIQDRLNEDGWQIDVLTFFEFIKSVIEAREYAKFIFTKSIHYFFDILVHWSKSYGFSKEDCSHMNVHDILALYSQSDDIFSFLKESVEKGKNTFQKMQSINLPSLLITPDDPFSFHHMDSSPNYITRKVITAPIVNIEPIQTESLKGKIVVIPQADPGFDWLFIKEIAGLITQYGGVNSHMAIRANELGIPAIIGCGPKLYEQFKEAKLVKIDCQSQKFHILKS